MTNPHKPRRRQRAMAARQALRLCEAELHPLTPDGAGTHQAADYVGPPRSRGSTVTARAALLAAGVPPDLAAALRRRLQLIPEQEELP